MKFKTKLYASIGSILILISIIVMILMSMLEQSTVNMHVVVNELSERIKLTSTIKYETANIGREIREITDTQANEINQTTMNEWEQSHRNISLAIESLEKVDTQDKSLELIAQFKTLQDSYKDSAQQVITMQKLDREVDFLPSMLNEVEITRQRMLQIAELLHGLQEQEMKNELLRSRETYNWAVKIIYIYLAVGLAIGIGITLWIIRSITRNLNNVTSVMTSVSNSNGTIFPRIEIYSKDEIGAIAMAFNKMAKALEEHSKLEKELKEEAEENSWLKTKVAEIATMYPQVGNIQMLAELLITKLVPMVGANCGVIYMKEVEGNRKYLKKFASYALSDEKKEFERFDFGEGLIGQCAADKRTFLLNQIPDESIKIHSGIVVASPKNTIILPVLFEDRVLAVIEIASFETFSSLQVKLLEEVISNIGITINSISNRMKVDKLLQESQTLTEELQVQSEEMQSQAEELQSQQEVLRTTNEKLEDQNKSSQLKQIELEKVRAALEEKAQQLELSSQYKSEFLANMSHELRTPLNSLLILAKILSENTENNLNEKQVEYIGTIYSSGNDLLHLINDILDLAKIESGKLEVIHQEVSFQKMQDFVIRQFSPIANQKKVQFTVQLEPGLPESLFTDEQRVKQVLKNLISNALKFTESGSVSLVVRNTIKGVPGQQNDTGIDQVQSMLAFSVIDTGIGIPKEKQNTIFDAFKQADGTTSRKYGGTGLGLSICREIAYLLDGYIEVESEEGKGSIFTLYLPYYQSSGSLNEVASSIDEEYLDDGDSLDNIDHLQEESSETLHGKPLLKGKKILLVDDDIRNVYALTIALEAYEMDILVAENGREGIDVLWNNPDTDLVLMDIMMPEMDGFEAMRRIRKMPEFTTLPIIALTAKAMKQSRDECLSAGATDYISKPINLDQLYSLMQVWLYRKEG